MMHVVHTVISMSLASHDASHDDSHDASNDDSHDAFHDTSHDASLMLQCMRA